MLTEGNERRVKAPTVAWLTGTTKRLTINAA